MSRLTISYLPTCVLAQGLMEGSVLVHCAGGRSRSAALVTAYLMSSRGWSFDYAVSVLKAVRPVIQINKGFEHQVSEGGGNQPAAHLLMEG